MRAGRARLHYVEREDPGNGRPDRAAPPSCPAELQHALTHASQIACPRHLALTGATRSKNPQATRITTINATISPYRLTTSSYAGVNDQARPIRQGSSGARHHRAHRRALVVAGVRQAAAWANDERFRAEYSTEHSPLASHVDGSVSLPAHWQGYELSCPAFSGQGICGYFTLLPARSGTRPGLLAVSGTRAWSGDESYCSGARSTAQYHPWRLCGSYSGPVDELVLQRPVHRFRQGIIIAYPGAPDGLLDAEFFEFSPNSAEV